jgi:hypothetical protein
MWYHKDKKLHMIVGVYVDDLIITGNNSDKIDELMNTLHKTYSMKNLGNANKFLGLEISQFRPQR